MEIPISKNAVYLGLWPVVPGVPQESRRALPLVLTASSDRVTPPGGSRGGCPVTWDSTPVGVISPQTALLSARVTPIKCVLGLRRSADRVKAREQRNSQVSAFPPPRNRGLSQAPAPALDRMRLVPLTVCLPTLSALPLPGSRTDLAGARGEAVFAALQTLLWK